MSNQPTLTTPRESFINPPLTPPSTESKPFKPSNQVSHFIRHLRLRKAGQALSDQPWIVFQLLPGDFEQLIAHLKGDEALWGFLENKARYDFFSSSNRLVLRMRTSTHESFLASVVLEIQKQLERIASGIGEAAEFAKGVKYRGSPRLHFPVDEIIGKVAKSNDETDLSEYDSHEPDATFKYLDAQWPCIVIEVSFSQKRKDLKYLAEDYILGSDGNIRIVVGLDIEYKQSKKATVSVWQPQYIKNEDGHEELISAQTVVDEEFRDNLGNPTGTGLEHQMKDLGIKTPINNTQSISISSSLLCEFVILAESEAAQVKERKGRMVPLKPGARKRRRERTPLEEMQLDDERTFLEQEEKDAKRAARRDDDYMQ